MNQDDFQLSPQELKAFDETELNEELLALSDESGLLDEMLAASKVGPTPEALRYEMRPDGYPRRSSSPARLTTRLIRWRLNPAFLAALSP